MQSIADLVREDISHQIAQGVEKDIMADDQDPLRWNGSLTDDFDVRLEHLEASKLVYDWVSRFCRVPVKRLFKNTISVPSVHLGSFLHALRALMGEHEVEDMRNISGSREEPPRYSVVQLDGERSEDFLIDGFEFMKADHPEEDGSTRKVKYVLHRRPAWFGMVFTLYTSYSDRQFNALLFDKAWQGAIENSFLKGAAFSISGDFLKRGKESWDGVFLEAENKKPLQRLVQTINKTGSAMESRGVVCLGPPGTGKTLSGRVMMNDAKATFIWISSRDFYRMGAFGGMSMAFDLARMFAPSIMFMEDIDNWLDSHSIDYLKTQMDGIDQATGVATVLTTNHPDRFPEALIDRPGRFHDVLNFNHPSVEIRVKMLLRWLGECDRQCVLEIADQTEGYSGAHLHELAKFARVLMVEDESSIEQAALKALAKVVEQKEMIMKRIAQAAIHDNLVEWSVCDAEYTNATACAGAHFDVLTFHVAGDPHEPNFVGALSSWDDIEVDATAEEPLPYVASVTIEGDNKDSDVRRRLVCDECHAIGTGDFIYHKNDCSVPQKINDARVDVISNAATVDDAADLDEEPDHEGWAAACGAVDDDGTCRTFDDPGDIITEMQKNGNPILPNGYPCLSSAETVFQGINEARMSADFVIVTSGKKPNRNGARVQIAPGNGFGGLDSTHFEKSNPVVLFGHGLELQLPIATARNPETGEVALTKTKPRAVSTAFFSQVLPEAELIFAMIAERMLNAASIQFMPSKALMVELKASNDEDDADEVIVFRGRRHFFFVEGELWEWSVVPIPADAQAVRRAVERGQLHDAKITERMMPIMQRMGGPTPIWSPGVKTDGNGRVDGGFHWCQTIGEYKQTIDVPDRATFLKALEIVQIDDVAGETQTLNSEPLLSVNEQVAIADDGSTNLEERVDYDRAAQRLESLWSLPKTDAPAMEFDVETLASRFGEMLDTKLAPVVGRLGDLEISQKHLTGGE